MKRILTAVVTAAALAAGPGAQALGVGVTPQKAAKIAKRVFHKEMRKWEASKATTESTAPVEHALAADYATNAGHAATAATASSARTAETAEVAGIAENCIAESANPMAYAFVHRTGRIEPWNSFRISQADVFLEPESGTYCFAAPRPKAIQATVELEETMRPRENWETFPAPPPGSWNSIGYQPTPPAPPGTLIKPMVSAGLGQGVDCPAGTEFYVRGFSAKNDDRGYVAFFLSLVL